MKNLAARIKIDSMTKKNVEDVLQKADDNGHSLVSSSCTGEYLWLFFIGY